MISAGLPGSIINIASGAALRGSPRGVHYVASKGGVLSLTRAMLLELAPYRIRVNPITPGLTDTAQPRDGSSEAEIAKMARSIPPRPNGAIGRCCPSGGVSGVRECGVYHRSDPACKRGFPSGVRSDG
jgi:NAD(P)-dependent dehydrogenase (short-subunit alcohol dehydrogenase family)